jgi:hypothetical protein
MRKLAASLLAALVSGVVLLPIVALALAIRIIPATVRLLARLLEPRYVPWTGLMRYDPVLGWKPNSDLDTYYLADRDDVFRVVTDAEGWPGTRPLDDCDVIALGDSFAFGYGADPEQMFSALNPALTVKGVGAPGYSMVHAVRLLDQLGRRLNGKLVVWLIYLENDLQDNLAPNMRQYRAPFMRLTADGGWEIVSEHISPEPWRCSYTNRTRLDMLAEFCVPGPIADRAFSASASLLGRAHALCVNNGAELAVVSLPHRILLHADGHAQLAAMTATPAAFDATLPDRRLAETCNRLGVAFVAGRDVFRYGDYKRHEGVHWNAQGHRRMAELLQRIYDKSSAAKSPGSADAAAAAEVPAAPA